MKILRTLMLDDFFFIFAFIFMHLEYYRLGGNGGRRDIG
jgi:hypothetical protein